VNAKAMAGLIDLLTDICRRNNIKQLLWKADKSLIGQVDKQNMTVHRWFAAKACPGDYLYERHGQIAAEVNKRLGATVTPPTPAPETPKPPVNDGAYTLQVGAYRVKAYADAFMEQLKKAGCTPYTETRSDGMLIVYVGKYATQAIAQGAKAALEKAGFTPILKKL